jgi:hypothetical protein
MHKPDVELGYKSIGMPFLVKLVSGDNRLKVCIVTGKDTQNVGIYLFAKYLPCCEALFTIWELVEVARLITKAYYMGAYIHPCAVPTTHADSDGGDFTTMLIQAFNQLPAPGQWRFPPPLGVGLVFSTELRLPLVYVKSLLAEMVALCRDPCQTYCDETKNAGGRMLSPGSVRLDFWGASIDEAMMIGESVSRRTALS